VGLKPHTPSGKAKEEADSSAALRYDKQVKANRRSFDSLRSLSRQTALRMTILWRGLAKNGRALRDNPPMRGEAAHEWGTQNKTRG
jgi:hypothetical protein